jgi:hypothetical protein
VISRALGIQGRCGFASEDDAGPAGQRGRDRHALCLLDVMADEGEQQPKPPGAERGGVEHRAQQHGGAIQQARIGLEKFNDHGATTKRMVPRIGGRSAETARHSSAKEPAASGVPGVARSSRVGSVRVERCRGRACPPRRR